MTDRAQRVSRICPEYIYEPHEIVSAAMGAVLRWDFRHDAMVRLIMDEFSLVLPRDRELVRQLALIRGQQNAAHVMPFGKHKGRLLEEILGDDPGYIDWLTEQEWFRGKFPTLHAAVISLDADEDAWERA